MKKQIASFLALGVLALSLSSFAQVADPGANNGGPNFNGPVNRPNITDLLRDQLVVPDDDVWKVLQPRLQKLINDEQIVRPSAGRGRRLNTNLPAVTDPAMEQVVQATAALNAVLQTPTAPADEVQAKGTALRQAREKAQQELQAEQKDLQGLLTVRQEMVLVALGYLD